LLDLHIANTVVVLPRMLPPRKGGVSELYAVPGIGKSPLRPPFVPALILRPRRLCVVPVALYDVPVL
jgi:hypothetical protein